jgi:opacity protein-like surface antigen
MPVMKRMKTSFLLFLTITFLVTPSSVSAFQIGLKGGYHFYPSSDYFDLLEESLLDVAAGDLNGPSVEVFVDLSILPMISLEFGLGGYSSETSISSLGAELELAVKYLLFTPKVHLLPVSSWDLYLGLGAGYYLVDQTVRVASDLLPSDDTGTFGFHACLGLGYKLTGNLLILVEGRYAKVTAGDFAGQERDLELGGTFVQGGLAVTW